MISETSKCVLAHAQGLRFTGVGELAFDCDATTRLRFLMVGVFRADLSFKSFFAAVRPARCSDTRRCRPGCVGCCEERSRLEVGARVRMLCTHASASSEWPRKKHASRALRFMSFWMRPHSGSSGTKVEAHNVSFSFTKTHHKNKNR